MTLLETLRQIGKRPGFYLTFPSIWQLNSFVNGWKCGGRQAYEGDEILDEMSMWVCTRFNVSMGAGNWALHLLWQSGEDEKVALNLFFELFEEYIKDRERLGPEGIKELFQEQSKSRRFPIQFGIRTNRSMPESVVIPEIPYKDLPRAVIWLCDVFGFQERLRIGNHRAQISIGTGAIVVTEGANNNTRCSIMVRVDSVDYHYEGVVRHGAKIIRAPGDHPYGERHYKVEDIEGHHWTFSQTIEDVDPATWGGVLRVKDAPKI